MSHILAGCDTLAKKEYFDRHNAVARYVHHSICDKLGVPTVKKWHLHKPPEVFMDSRYEIIWDMVLPTDRPCGANRPDIVVREKEKKKAYIIDVACPNDINVNVKEQEKLSKYCALRVELGRMWDCECVVVPVVVGGMGTVSESFERYLKMLPGDIASHMCIKITLLGSERILRSLLSRR